MNVKQSLVLHSCRPRLNMWYLLLTFHYLASTYIQLCHANTSRSPIPLASYPGVSLAASSSFSGLSSFKLLLDYLIPRPTLCFLIPRPTLCFLNSRPTLCCLIPRPTLCFLIPRPTLCCLIPIQTSTKMLEASGLMLA